MTRQTIPQFLFYIFSKILERLVAAWISYYIISHDELF